MAHSSTTELQIAGRKYRLYRSSDNERDGMALELMDETTSSHALVMEVFYSDVDGAFSFSSFRNEVPLELVELLISNARVSLPPSV